MNRARALVTGGAGFLGSHLCDALPVSYTHLDVYKRQRLSNQADFYEGVPRAA